MGAPVLALEFGRGLEDWILLLLLSSPLVGLGGREDDFGGDDDDVPFVDVVFDGVGFFDNMDDVVGGGDGMGVCNAT